MSQFLSSIAELESEMSKHKIAWDLIAPRKVSKWLDTFSKSFGCSKDLVFVNMLGVTGALLGDSVIQLGNWKESGNLFMVALAPSGSGKTPACRLATVDPIIDHLEQTNDRTGFLVDETSANGLFNLIVSVGKRDVPILCIDEAFNFFSQLVTAGKSQSSTSLTMDRLCKLYDGDFWYKVKGSIGKRTGVSNARISMVCLTTPYRFLTESWPKVISFENGLADRILLFYSTKETLSLEEIEDSGKELERLNLKHIKFVYERIYAEHHQKLSVSYKLTEEAYEAFKVGTAAKKSSSSQINSKISDSKAEKNILRLALVLHVLWHRITESLNLSVQPTANLIREETMEMALALHDTFSTISGISESCIKIKEGGFLKMTIQNQTIKEKIFSIPGPCVSKKRVYNSFSSSHRPSTSQTQESFDELEKEGWGECKKYKNSMVFYKIMPSEMENNEDLIKYISYAQFLKLFFEKDILTSSTQRNRMLDEHPNRQKLIDAGYDVYDANV